MRRWIVASLCLAIIVVSRSILTIAGRATFVPEFLQATGMKYISTSHDLDVPTHCYTGKVPFTDVERAAKAEMDARGYQTSAEPIGRHWWKAGTMKGVLLRDHRYLPGGRLVEAKGWTSFWYVQHTALPDQLAEGLGIKR